MAPTCAGSNMPCGLATANTASACARAVAGSPASSATNARIVRATLISSGWPVRSQ